jgi:HK97 family phage portal protein
MGLPPRAERALLSDADVPGLTEQLLAVQGVRSATTPWLPPRPRDAYTNPTVFRAVSLLSTVAGSLSLEAFRNGSRMEEPPTLIRRPDPFTSLREFVRDSVWSLAYWGETLWWSCAPRVDGLIQALQVTDPVEWSIAWDTSRKRRVYRWRNTEIDPRDVVHVTYLRALGEARGHGPLQKCGAALSVAQAADEWAARFFATGGAPSVVIEHPDELTGDEADDLKAIWAARNPNEPAVLSGGIKATPYGINPEGAQLTESRTHSVGDVARMFGIPGHLMEYGAPGSSLTYQNIGAVGDELVRFTLAPGYLEPIEVALSDCLSRTTVARFNVEGLLRADIKSRFEVYQLGMAAGMLTADEARRMEGLAPGGIETAPVPANPAPLLEVPTV